MTRITIERGKWKSTHYVFMDCPIVSAWPRVQDAISHVNGLYEDRENDATGVKSVEQLDATYAYLPINVEA